MEAQEVFAGRVDVFELLSIEVVVLLVNDVESAIELLLFVVAPVARARLIIRFRLKTIGERVSLY